MGLWIEFVDAQREWLDDAEAAAVSDVLWASRVRGAVTVAAKISHARRQSTAVEYPAVALDELEHDLFRATLDGVRRQAD